jgi:hypothetical protein
MTPKRQQNGLAPMNASAVRKDAEWTWQQLKLFIGIEPRRVLAPALPALSTLGMTVPAHGGAAT